MTAVAQEFLLQVERISKDGTKVVIANQLIPQNLMVTGKLDYVGPRLMDISPGHWTLGRL